MSYGLLALLDDIAALAKMAAGSLDDIAAQSMRSGSQSIGIVIDDAAVTPQFVSGVSPARELPAILRIAKWSIFNKLVIIMPAALALSAFLPAIITPLLMLGGLYLAFEGAEKVLEWTGLHAHHDPDHEAGKGEKGETGTPVEAESATVSGAIRTDFILSCEIMVLTLSSVSDQSLGTQIGVMTTIAVVFTLAVYGVVALIVRADDFGLRLVKTHGESFWGRIGRQIVKGVAPFLTVLGIVGTLAMLWVGGSLLIHGLAVYHYEWPEHAIHEVAVGLSHAIGVLEGAVEWSVTAFFQGVVALAAGIVVALGVSGVERLRA